MVGPLLVGAPSRSGSVCGRDLSTAVALACLVLANFGKIEVADL
jgi:hypothetical protein